MQVAHGVHADIAQRLDAALAVVDLGARHHRGAAIGSDGATAVVYSLAADVHIAAAPERAVGVDDSAADIDRQCRCALVSDCAAAIVQALRMEGQAVGGFNDAAAVVHQAVVGGDCDA